MRLKEIKPGMVIRCKTEEEANELMLHLESKGLTWGTGENPTCNNRFSIFGEFTCYKIHEGYLTFDCYSHFESSNSIITEFSDLIIPELSAKEVLETMADICKEYTLNGCGTKCPLMNNCLFEEIAEDIDKTIAICAKWREEHKKEEKKELETEWVYAVRIIKVENNGFKKCVYEEDFPALIEKPVVEDVLKHYCSEHKGNFFATLEHICRIKE